MQNRYKFQGANTTLIVTALVLVPWAIAEARILVLWDTARSDTSHKYLLIQLLAPHLNQAVLHQNCHNFLFPHITFHQNRVRVQTS